MIIERIDVRGFGKLLDVSYSLAPGLNVFFGNNEAGKSTLQEAILALLYGFYSSPRASSRETAKLEAFRPWSGGSYGATLEYVLTDGRRYRVERDFSTSDIPTRVWDLTTGRDVTDHFGRSRHGIVPFAQQHLGLSKEVFVGTAFINQGEVRQFEEAEKVTETLVSLSETGTHDTSAVVAVNILDDLIGKIGTERGRVQPLHQARRRLQESQDELRTLRENRVQIAELVAQRESLEQNLSATRLGLEELNLQIVLAKLTDLEARETRTNELDEHIQSREEEIRSLQPHSAFPEHLYADVATQRGSLKEAQEQLHDLEEESSGRKEELDQIERSVQQLNVNIADLAFVHDFPVNLETEVRTLEAEWRQRLQVEPGLKARQQRWQLILGLGVGVGLLLAVLGLFVIGVPLTLGSAAVWILRRTTATKAADDLEPKLRAALDQAGVADTADVSRALAAFYERAQKRQGLLGLENDLQQRITRRDSLLAQENTLKERRQAVARHEAQLRRYYAEADITDQDLEQAWESFQESYRRKQEFDRLSQELEGVRRERQSILMGQSSAQLSMEARQLESRKDAILANNPQFVDISPKDTIADLESRFQNQDKKRQDLEVQVAQLEKEIEVRTEGQRAVAELEEDVARYEQEVKSLENTRTALEIAKKTIQEAAEEARRDFAPKLNDSLAQNLHRVTEGHYSRALVDPGDFKVTMQVPETGQMETIDRLSFGTQELVSFYLRLSLAQLMSTMQEPIPLFLDDCLVNVDEPRTARIMEFLAEHASAYQILLFTQEPEIRDWSTKNCQNTNLHRLYEMT